MAIDNEVGPPLSKTEYVLERIRREMRDGSVIPGQSLRQAELAQRYGVSPTPVREALRLLEAEGAISYSPHRGATVVELSPRRIEDLYRLRATVEGLATQLAVERMEEGVLEGVRELHERIKEGLGKEDGRVLSKLNREMHFAIYHRSSPLVAEHVASLWRFLPPEVTLWSNPVAAAELVAQHEQIYSALVAADASRASELMAEHIITAANYRFRQVDGAPTLES